MLKNKAVSKELDSKNTEVMVVSKNKECPQINICINGYELKQRDQFKYLGSLISSDERNNPEIAPRIAQAKKNFQRMKSVLTNNHISIHTRRRFLECYIEPILMYILIRNQDNFKTSTKETESKRNLPTEKAKIHMSCKEIK